MNRTQGRHWEKQYSSLQIPIQNWKKNNIMIKTASGEALDIGHFHSISQEGTHHYHKWSWDKATHSTTQQHTPNLIIASPVHWSQTLASLGVAGLSVGYFIFRGRAPCGLWEGRQKWRWLLTGQGRLGKESETGHSKNSCIMAQSLHGGWRRGDG